MTTVGHAIIALVTIWLTMCLLLCLVLGWIVVKGPRWVTNLARQWILGRGDRDDRAMRDYLRQETRDREARAREAFKRESHDL